MNTDEKLRALISGAEIAEAVKRAGKTIDGWYDGHPMLLVSVLKGAFVFLADVCRAVTVPCELDFMRVKSYSGTKSSGEINIITDLERDIKDYNVVIAEDIIDTGKTLAALTKALRARNPRSLRVITLLDKPSRRETDIEADLSLFTIPDLFVVGYGLDYDEKYRNLPYIAEYGGE